MKRLVLKFCILLTINFGSAQLNLEHGSSCFLKNGLFGSCVDISSCPQLRTLLTNGKISRDDITICNEDLRYLCCPSASFEAGIATLGGPSGPQEITTTEPTTIASTTTQTFKSTESIFVEDDISEEPISEARKLNHYKM